MMKILYWGLLCCFFLQSALAEDPVQFDDPLLKQAVEDALYPISDPTPTDMLDLVDLRCIKLNIESLKGIEFATNLQTLWIRHTSVRLIYPLAGLTNLRTLIINNNKIRDISALTGLVNLEHLDMHDNRITDVSVVSHLTRLTTLIFRGNDVSDISVLSALTNLQHLDIWRNTVSDISPLVDLTELRKVILTENPLSQESCQVTLSAIIANNPQAAVYHNCDPSILTVTSSAGGTVIEPGEGEFELVYGSSVLLEAQADPNFVFDTWTTGSRDPSITITMGQDRKLHANFVSKLDTVYVDASVSRDAIDGESTHDRIYMDGSMQHPFSSIQEAINLAANDTTIMVRPGRYTETVNFLRKRVQVASDCSDGASYPVIDGNREGPVVRISGYQDANTLLSGFVITGGEDSLASALEISGCHPTIANCLIRDNHSHYDADMSIQDQGAAVYCKDSEARFINCTIVDNDGIGLYLVDSNVVVTNSILQHNSLIPMFMSGTSLPRIDFSSLSCDLLGYGQGNMCTDPLFVRLGKWELVYLNPTEVHAPYASPLPQSSTTAMADYVPGDYHLRSQGGHWDSESAMFIVDVLTSPCIDAGDPNSLIGSEQDPNGFIINMGAYGGTAEASKSYYGE